MMRRLTHRSELIALAFLSFVPHEVVSGPGTNGVGGGSLMRLPIMLFQTPGTTVQDRTRVPFRFTILDSRSNVSQASLPIDYTGKAELSVRGNSSYHFSKKSYRLELQDEDRMDRKAPLLGMPADSDWVLYASVTDRTFVRNLLGHELWRRTGRYAVRWRFAEVFVITNAVTPATSPEDLARELPRVLDALSVTNPSAAALTFSNSQNHLAATLADSYMGVYVVMEKIKRGRDTVNIARHGHAGLI